MRACRRDTAGSDSSDLESAARPSVTAVTSGTRRTPSTTRSSGAPAPPIGAPHDPHQLAPRSSWRRQAGHSTLLPSRHEGLEDRVVAVHLEIERLLRSEE